ncbi:MAG: pirin family protein [Candidatus Eremiobacteraeota bacterium]|nr:pirin family protein [Candidatus Eremiobacteraeota bacterium]
MAMTSVTVRVQRAGDRYFGDHGWLRTHHSFSFADYYDPENLNWGALRVLNDDCIAPGRGFDTHPHHDMEIITYVLEGQLEHRDSMGNRGVVGPGGVQYMSAGTGVAHSEYNPSQDRELRLIQMWILPGRRGLKPAYGQIDFTADARLDRWLTIAAGPGAPAPIQFSQNATFLVSRLESKTIGHNFAAGRLGFLFVADGDVVVNEEKLNSGDALRIAGLDELSVTGKGEVLLWDLPKV